MSIMNVKATTPYSVTTFTAVAAFTVRLHCRRAAAHSRLRSARGLRVVPAPATRDLGERLLESRSRRGSPQQMSRAAAVRRRRTARRRRPARRRARAAGRGCYWRPTPRPRGVARPARTPRVACRAARNGRPRAGEQVVGMPAQRFVGPPVTRDAGATPASRAADVRIPAALEAPCPKRRRPKSRGAARAPLPRTGSRPAGATGFWPLRPRSARLSRPDPAARSWSGRQRPDRAVAARRAGGPGRAAPAAGPAAQPPRAAVGSAGRNGCCGRRRRCADRRAAHAAGLAGALVDVEDLLKARASRRDRRSSRPNALVLDAQAQRLDDGRVQPLRLRGPTPRPGARDAGGHGTGLRRRRCCPRRRGAADR